MDARESVRCLVCLHVEALDPVQIGVVAVSLRRGSASLLRPLLTGGPRGCG